MSGRPTGRAALVLLVAIAGCGAMPGATSGGADGRAAATPAPVPTTAGADERVSAYLERPERLAAAQVAALTDRAYTVSATETHTFPNGTLRRRIAVTLRVAPDGTFRASLDVAGSGVPLIQPPARAEYWSDGDRYLRALTRNGSTEYARLRRGGTIRRVPADTVTYWFQTVLPGGQPWRDLHPLFRSIETRVAGADPNATGAYRVESVRVTDRAGLAAAEDVTAPREVRLTASIHGDGRLRRYRLAYAARVGGDPVTVERSVRYRWPDRGAIERPEWYATAAGTPNGSTPGRVGPFITRESIPDAADPDVGEHG